MSDTAMTDLTSEEYRELADLCKVTAENLRRITKATRGFWLNGKECFTDAADQLYPDTANRFGEKAIYAKRREDAESQLREDIRAMAKAGEGHVDVDAIIRRVREEKS